ncbi:MAG: hypothetical protein V3W22_01465 [Thermoplasmata archaeon]
MLGLSAVFLVVYPPLDSLRIGYRQSYAAVVLLAFSLALPLGVVIGYTLLRPLLPRMALGQPISEHALLLRGFGDLFVFGGFLAAFILTIQLVFGGGYGVRFIQDLTQVLYAVFVGYLLGANAVRTALGLRWERSQRLAASPGRAPMGP